MNNLIVIAINERGLVLANPSHLRQIVDRKVKEYCEYHKAQSTQTYAYLYKRLYQIWGVNVYTLPRNERESLIDAAERDGHLERIYSLISAELIFPEEQ
ncbi:hypothetical protein [Spirosoma foliorum]|uniref:Uncharacterized protein n=1 Tax=Spirosoma foliorum TaxID=2710596 RepID=A0A7G5H5H3_9BACT|nr:hypothetical protein [Spirosoma foliorum]QMW06365.1 hypothetical protein H3H32_16475 [Spirosoma foliorum]